MAWEGSTRSARLPEDWPLRRLRVLRHAGYRCQVRTESGRVCRAPANEVDHKVPGDDHSYENLQAICRRHHELKTQAEAQAARRLKAKRRPQSEPHPGLLLPNPGGGPPTRGDPRHRTA